jgi:hypothetical protein
MNFIVHVMTDGSMSSAKLCPVLRPFRSSRSLCEWKVIPWLWAKVEADETMKHLLIISGALLVCISLQLLLPPFSTSHALPEYAAQTGEPCSSCHVSASGGGPRGPRGQAWVASGKSSTVPDLVDSLELLGVELNTDAAYFKAASPGIMPAEPLKVTHAQGHRLLQWLSQYDGN